jgi:hypothetical protein
MIHAFFQKWKIPNEIENYGEIWGTCFFFETWDEMGQSVNEDSLATYAN